MRRTTSHPSTEHPSTEHPSTAPPSGRRLRRPMAALALVLLVAVTGCQGQAQAETPVLREPVSFTGDNPFSPAVGTDRPEVTPPPGAGGSFPGDTAGLFGGTENESTCDKAKLVEFLQQDRAKASAWAAVIGIPVADIPTFVATLTPAFLRSDTRVTNHGFRDGKAVQIPAVLQAGTAVLVDVHGAPVTKCFCGNPLTPPAATTAVVFTGPQWTTFSPNDVTVVVPVTQTVQQFVFVEPVSGQSFQRPAGTTGAQDAPAPAPAPTTFAPPTSPLPPPTAIPPTSTAAPGPPPGNVIPSATPSPSAPAPSPTSAAVPPGPGSPSPSPTASPPTSPMASAPTSPTASAPTSPTASPPTSPPTSPTASPPTSPTASPPTSPTASPSGSVSPTGIVRASWVVGDCFVQGGRAHGLVQVRADATTQKTFRVEVRLGEATRPVAVETVRVVVPPGQIGQAEVNARTSTPDGKIQCDILSIVDDATGTPPVAGDPLPPPTDSVPLPGQPSPGENTGPPPTPPNPVVPAPS